jgi:hypothetical protein
VLSGNFSSADCVNFVVRSSEQVEAFGSALEDDEATLREGACGVEAEMALALRVSNVSAETGCATENRAGWCTASLGYGNVILHDDKRRQ